MSGGEWVMPGRQARDTVLAFLGHIREVAEGGDMREVLETIGFLETAVQDGYRAATEAYQAQEGT